MGCCVTTQNRISPDIVQRRNVKFQIIDGRNNSQIYTDERVKTANFQTQKQDIDMLDQTISNHTFLYRLPNNQRSRLIQCFESFQCLEGTEIFKKGDHASLFFIIKTGRVSIFVNEDEEQKNSVLGRGDYFGDLALLYTAPRSATAQALTDCEFYCISHEIFRKTAQDIVKKNYEFAKNFIEKVHIFKFLTKRQKTLITYNTLVLKYQKDQVIFKEGDDANSFYVITMGKILIRIPGKKTLMMQVGESFGENSFKSNQIRSGTAVAAQKTALISIGRESLRKCLGNQLQDISYYNILKWSLNRDSVFKMGSKIQRQKMTISTQISYEREGSVIYEEGSLVQYLIIVLEGETNGLEPGSILNKQYLAAQNQNDLKLTEKIVQTKTGSIGKISLEIIHNLFGKRMTGLLNKTVSKQALLELTHKREEYLKSLTLDEFTVKAKIGQGQFGKVYLVEDKLKKRYAMKCIKKNKIILHKMQKFVLKEKEILQSVQHPFIIKLYKTFKDDYFIYFLLNMIKGADLFDLLREIGICNKKKAQFYAGCIILALQYLHEKNIIYRDLKPENAVIDESGYLYLIDMGIAKVLTEEEGFRTFTVIGTPHYMAPEIVELEGYSFSSDLWSLGIILYEMLCGELPYGNNIDDPYEIFKDIYSSDLKFPKFFQDSAGRQLISKLLLKSPSQRFIEEFSKLKNMKFFQDFDWQELNKKEMKPPLKIKHKSKQISLNDQLLSYLKREKANLGAALVSTEIDWDKHF